MINMPGKNEFKGLFNPYEWSAPVYETPIEVLTAYKSFKISDKKIVNVRAIGGALWLTLSDWKQQFKTELQKSDVPDTTEIQWKDLKKFAVNRTAFLAEPIVFTFEDDSTFEFCSYVGGYVRMSVNTIPSNIEDGLNRSNIDLHKLFPSDYIGSTLGRMTIVEDKKNYYSHENVELKNNNYCIDVKSIYCWQSDNYYCYVKQERYVYFDFFVTDKYGEEPKKIELGMLMEARKQVNQLELSRGSGGYEYYAYNPYHNNHDFLNAFDIFLYRIGNLYSHSLVDGYLFDFDILDRYFDKSINRRSKYGDENEGFDSYRSNKYSCNSLRRMIARMCDKDKAMISSCEYSRIKYNIEYFRNRLDWYPEVNEAEDDEILSAYYVYLVSDVRNRFYNYLEGLMKISNIDGISITGLE